MRSVNFTLLFLFLLVGFACEEDQTSTATDITLNFKGLYGDQPLVMFDDEYTYEDNMDLKFQLFQFYISEVSLLKEDKSQTDGTMLTEIDLVSFDGFTSLEQAQEGVNIAIKDIPKGEYSGIKIGLGVPADLNATQPGDYNPPHPLDNHYWSWARGFVFAKVEGNADLDQDGTFEEKLTFHIGENDFYREKIIEQSIAIQENSTLNFTVDLEQVLVDAQGAYLDFRTVSQDHTNDLDLAAFIMDNLVQAIELK